jgi:hypothetical protein
MKKIYSMALLVGLAGLINAGCGGLERKAGSEPITIQGTTTIANVETGTLVSCKDGPKNEVPPAGHEVTAISDGPSSSTKIQIAHQQDGSIVVICRS